MNFAFCNSPIAQAPDLFFDMQVPTLYEIIFLEGTQKHTLHLREKYNAAVVECEYTEKSAY